MTLYCRPVGRGNWHLWVFQCPDPVDLYRFKVEDRFTVPAFPEPVTLRIVRIAP